MHSAASATLPRDESEGEQTRGKIYQKAKVFFFCYSTKKYLVKNGTNKRRDVKHIRSPKPSGSAVKTGKFKKKLT